MGLNRVPEDELRAWVEQSCAAQGVPEKVTDPVVVAQVARLLTAGTGRPAPARQRGRSDGTGVRGATPE
jgi:hypothetical protein